MFTVRLGVFETNSSSEHCLVTLNRKEYEEFLNNERIILIGADTSFTIKDFAEHIISISKDFVGYRSSLDAYEEEFEDSKKDEPDFYGDYMVKLPMLEGDNFSPAFKKFYKHNYGRPFKYNTLQEYQDSCIKDGDFFSVLSLDRVIEILNLCKEQNCYCDDHMSAYGVYDIKGPTKEEQNFVNFGISNDTGFIIGKKGLDNLPKWSSDIDEHSDGSVTISFDTIG